MNEQQRRLKKKVYYGSRIHFDETKGFYRIDQHSDTSGHMYRYCKRYYNRKVRRNNYEYFGKTSAWKKEFDLWWTMY